MRDELWMAVTADRYQLPLSVADTCRKLEKRMGVKPGALLYLNKVAGISRHPFNGMKYTVIKIKVNEENE